jgi:hypothetical protein
LGVEARQLGRQGRTEGAHGAVNLERTPAARGSARQESSDLFERIADRAG